MTEELANLIATVAKRTEKVEQSGVLLNTYTNALTAKHDYFFHLHEVTTNFTNIITKVFIASVNESTELLREYGIIPTTSGGRNGRLGTRDIPWNTDNGTPDAEV